MGRDSDPGAGWFKQPDGRLRYWDGSSWTRHFCAPAEIRVGWYRQPDGQRCYWDGRRWSLAVALPDRPGRTAAGSPRQGSMFRLPLFAAASSLAVAIIWLAVVGRPDGSSASPSDVPGSSAQPDPRSGPSSPSAPTPSTPRPTSRGAAAAALAESVVKGRAPMTGYDRDLFGFGRDTDGNGCDTRDDVLARDLVGRVVLATDACVTETGQLHDPYGGEQISFSRADSAVDVDHVVALGNAWVTGAYRWDEATREAFANDPLNLLAVDLSLNRQKGDGDAATWLPPQKAFRCAYVARQIAVKKKYDLWLTPPERTALTGILRRCPDQELPRGARAHPTAPVGTAQPQPTATDQPEQPSTSEPFANCDEARAAGAAPVHRGAPGYAPHLDRDNDGVGCDD